MKLKKENIVFGLALLTLFVFTFGCTQVSYSGRAFYPPPTNGTPYVQRNFSNLTPAPGTNVTVRIVVRSLSNDTILAIDELLPVGFSAADIMYVDGNASLNDTTGGQHIKWLIYSNLTLVPNSTFNYTIKVPSTAGEYKFRGQYQYEYRSNTSIFGDDSFNISIAPSLCTITNASWKLSG